MMWENEKFVEIPCVCERMRIMSCFLVSVREWEICWDSLMMWENENNVVFPWWCERMRIVSRYFDSLWEWEQCWNSLLISKIENNAILPCICESMCEYHVSFNMGENERMLRFLMSILIVDILRLSLCRVWRLTTSLMNPIAEIRNFEVPLCLYRAANWCSVHCEAVLM